MSYSEFVYAFQSEPDVFVGSGFVSGVFQGVGGFCG